MILIKRTSLIFSDGFILEYNTFKCYWPMNVISRIINLGTDRQTDTVSNRHIRFANSTSLIVCFFAVQNAMLAIFYSGPVIAVIFLIHFALLTLMPVFNPLGKRVLASAWFSGV